MTTPQLTWRVDVWRRGVDDHPIGCLEVNQTNLPPRTNKAGKVLWKLPTDPTQVPKFGVLEQRRLWELFKEQKKLRRKQSKTTADGGAGSGGGGGSGSSTVGSSDEPHDFDGSSSKADNEASSAAAAAETDPQPPIPRSPESPATNSLPKQSPLPSPPPGFTTAVANLSVNEPHNSQSTVPLQPPLPPPGLTAASPGPPPRGTIPSPAGESTKQHVAAEPPSVPPTLAPRSLPPLSLPCGYFTLSPVDRIAFPGSLADRVAATFRLLVATTTSSGGGTSRIAEWLAHYDPTAPSTLVMGTAQAVATSHADKLRQWYSLTTTAPPAAPTSPDGHNPSSSSPHPATRWDCQGWTAQVLPSDSVATATAPAALVLVVLTGRTWQQHLLAFQLTLVLREERATMANSPIPLVPPPPGSYRICNEILCLSLLNSA